MNKLMSYIVGGFLALLISHQAYSYAATAIKEKLSGVTETGINSETEFIKYGTSEIKRAVLFNSYNVGTDTAVYNNDGGSAATSGWVDVRDFNDAISFSVNVATLGSTGNTLTWQGLYGDDTSNLIQIYQKAFSAVDADYPLPIGSEKGGLDYIRVKLQATGTEGTDAVTVKLNAEGKR